MTIRFMRRIAYLPIASLLLAGSLFATPREIQPCEPTPTSSSWDFPSEASSLLKEVHGVAGQLRRDADRLESLNRSKVSWQSHAQQLNQVREHINSSGEVLARLNQVRHVTLPWQQQAIDRINPLMKDLASRTESAILHLNENRTYLFAPDYQELLSTISDRADELHDSVSTYLTLAETQQKLERLQLKLEDAGV